MVDQEGPLWWIKGGPTMVDQVGPSMVDQGGPLWWIKGPTMVDKGAHYGGSREPSMANQGDPLWWIKGGAL